MSNETTEYRYVSRTAGGLAGGAPLGPGDVVSLDADAVKANKRLIEQGALIKVPDPKPKAQEPKGGGS